MSGQNMSNNKQIVSLQFVRAFAAWYVVMHHFGKELTSSFATFFAQQGNFGVDLFFVISGFIMYYVTSIKNTTAKTFLLDRLFRIVPAYWTITLVFLAEKFMLGSEFGYTDWNLKTLLMSLFFIPAENPAGIGPFPPLVVGWTLNVEMFFYLLVASCFVFTKKFRFIICASVLLVLPFVWDKEWVYGSVLGTRKLCEFVFGIVLGSLYLKHPRIVSWFQSNSIYGLCLIPPSIALLYLDRDGMRFLAASLLVTSALMLENTLRAINDKVNVFSTLGNISYSTYLVHYLCIGLLIHFTGVPQNSLSEIVDWLALIAMTLVSSFVCFKFIENNELIKKVKKLFLM